MAAMSASPSADLSPLAAMVARENNSVEVTSSPVAPAVNSTYAATSAYKIMPSSTSSSSSSSWLTTPLVVVDRKSTASTSRRSSLISGDSGVARNSSLDLNDSNDDASIVPEQKQPGWLAQRLGATISWNSGVYQDAGNKQQRLLLSQKKNKKKTAANDETGLFEEEELAVAPLSSSAAAIVQVDQMDLERRMSTLNSAMGKMRASLRDMNAVAPSNF